MLIELLCPSCGSRRFDFKAYESAMLLSPKVAMVQYLCPTCKMQLSATLRLDREMLLGLEKDLAKQRCAVETEQTTTQHIDAHTLDAKQQTQQQPRHLEPNVKISYSCSMIVDGYFADYMIVRPLHLAAQDIKEQTDYFKNQLDDTSSVDEVIKKIDGFKPRKFPRPWDL